MASMTRGRSNKQRLAGLNEHGFCEQEIASDPIHYNQGVFQ